VRDRRIVQRLILVDIQIRTQKIEINWRTARLQGLSFMLSQFLNIMD